MKWSNLVESLWLLDPVPELPSCFVVLLWTDPAVKVVAPPLKEATQQHRVFMETHPGLFILWDTDISHGVYSDAEEPASLFCLPPRGLGRQKAADLFISFAARDRDREDVSPVNKARPARTALVSLCLFGISTEVLPHQTFLFKCCQHHMSGRQIDWGLLHISSLETCDWAPSINKPEPVIGPAPPPHTLLQTPALVYLICFLRPLIIDLWIWTSLHAPPTLKSISIRGETEVWTAVFVSFRSAFAAHSLEVMWLFVGLFLSFEE